LCRKMALSAGLLQSPDSGDTASYLRA
jgi:hypothetical protein